MLIGNWSNFILLYSLTSKKLDKPNKEPHSTNASDLNQTNRNKAINVDNINTIILPINSYNCLLILS